MPSIDEQYESKHLRLIANLAKRIKAIYESSIVEISIIAAAISAKEQKFSLSLYPLIEKKIDQQMKSMHREMYSALLSGVKNNWDLSNEKNDLIVDRRLAGKRPRSKARQILYDPNKQALDAFIRRKSKGLDLSRRVWKQIKPFKKEMEQALGIHISEGRSARGMATELKKYLTEPDRLYRRVREDGKLRLSANARNYHPGQGVYRSSYKNALRLSRTENNMAYRSADYERWQKLPFVVGVEIRLSHNHPVYDICDSLVGRYPKNFKFRGWHPQCICHAVPIMMTDEEYEKYEDKILGIGELDERTISRVVNIPTRASNWIQANSDRINGWKNRPFWASDNPRYMTGIL